MMSVYHVGYEFPSLRRSLNIVAYAKILSIPDDVATLHP